MREQIWIAPDGGREMGVSVVTQAKVTDIVGAIHRLLHRAQQHRL